MTNPHQMTTTCRCGTPMQRVANGDDTWGWTAEGGIVVESFPGGCTNQYEALNWLRDQGAIASYSAMACAVDLGGHPFATHVHRAIETTAPPPPWCCDMPMWLRPSGWWCRVENVKKELVDA